MVGVFINGVQGQKKILSSPFDRFSSNEEVASTVACQDNLEEALMPLLRRAVRPKIVKAIHVKAQITSW